MSNRVWRSRSELGRISVVAGVAKGRPRNSPPTIRMRLPCRRLRRTAGPTSTIAEVDAGSCSELAAEVVAEHAAADFAQLAFVQIAELKGTERNADEAVGHQTEVSQHLLHLAILALAQTHDEPDIGALDAVDGGFD